MRLFPPINRTTLDSFHRDVYRPRLSLLLLILLLILGQQHQHEQSQQINHPNLSTAKAIRDTNGKLKVTQYTESDKGLIKQLTPLLDQLPDRIRLDKSPIAIRWVKKAGELTWKGTSQEVQKSTEAIPIDKTQAEQIKKSLRNKLATGKRSNKSTFSSPLRRTKGGKKKEQSYGSLLAKVLNADALSALISLHLLWAIRLGSMLLEDRLGKENSTTSSSNLSLSQSYIWLIVSAFLALLSSFFSWSTVFQRWGIIRPPTHTTPAIAIQILTILELSATFVSFLPPLFRIRASPLAQFMPRKISLPSPSHSPSLLELLPIPAGLIEALKAPREDTTMYSRRRTTNQWHGGGRHMIAAPLPGINAGDLTGAAAAAAANAANADQSSRSNRRRNGLAEPLRMPRTNAGKAPRMKGMRVNVDSTWLLENVVILYGHSIGAIQYIVVIASLPTFAPTSFPSLLSLLSLRSALGSVITTWCSARRSVECLEFVQRRWSQQQQPPPPPPPQSSSLTSSICSMCFEIVDDTDDPEDCCTLDCGHQLHSVCLVQWLTKQAFCPCCHSTLKATPPSMRTTAETTAPIT